MEQTLEDKAKIVSPQAQNEEDELTRLRRELAEKDAELRRVTEEHGPILGSRVNSHEPVGTGGLWEFVIETPDSLLKLYMRRVRRDVTADPTTDEIRLRPTQDGIVGEVRCGRIWYQGGGQVLCERKVGVGEEPSLDDVDERA